MTDRPVMNPWGSFQRTVAATASSIKNYRHSENGMLVVSAVLGVGIGLAVVVFRGAMRIAEDAFQDVFLSADRSFHGGQYVFPLITAAGGLAVGLLGRTVFARAHEEGLHGVITAIRERAGKMHWVSAVKAVFGAALSIGSGGGGGKEGPIILMGASIGSTLGQLGNLRTDALRTLCAAGAAAAISGIFNAPLAGVIFAIEAIYGEFVVRSFVPVVVASVLATVVRRVIVGSEPVIEFAMTTSLTLTDYGYIAIAGLSCGLLAIYYLKVYRWMHRGLSATIKSVPEFVRPAIGGLLAGILAAMLPTMLETSYRPVNYAIAGQYTLMVVIASFLIKPISNAVTLSSGGSGGTFAPAIKAGAMWGVFVATALQALEPSVPLGLLSIVGAAAVLAGTWRIPLTAAILLCESTNNFEILLPVLFATILSVFVVEKVRSAETFNPLEAEE